MTSSGVEGSVTRSPLRNTLDSIFQLNFPLLGGRGCLCLLSSLKDLLRGRLWITPQNKAC